MLVSWSGFILRSFTFKENERVKDVERLLIIWEIDFEDSVLVNRYCSGCGGKVAFKDSLKRRRNANGKIIYEYAIYKCDREHTWNKLINTYNAKDYVERQGSDSPAANKEKDVNKIRIEECIRDGFSEIEIFIKKVVGIWRLDKLLGHYLEGISRSQIEKMIKSGVILVDNEAVATKTMIKEGRRILVILR